ncbi:MAG: DEAD/DEAH box helicase family protein, partial [Desulfobacterales bacterium]
MSAATEKRRTGAGIVSSQDIWIQEPLIRDGQIAVPRLTWAKRNAEEPETPAHISVVFNAFESKVAAVSKEKLKKDCPLEIHGLSVSLERSFSPSPAPTWMTWIPFSTSGEKHPSARVLTDRIEKIHYAVMRSVTRSLGGSEDAWPVLITEISSSAPKDKDPSDSVKIILGKEEHREENIAWQVSIRSNPHLMIVGKSGMGKTTALINICRQLYAQSVNPIIFSYHEDIDAKLLSHFGELNRIDYDGLGFNPLKTVSDSPRAYIDNAGMIRDIFAAIFPDIGDIQMDKIRQAIKQSYEDLGWGESERKHKELKIPSFQAFYDILKSDPKSEEIIARLRELNDYDFFRQAEGDANPFSAEKPSIVRIHHTQNGLLQQAFANFVLYHLYQSMFVRGEQKRITHAIIFDEAHRAGRMKLLSTFVKECR